MLKIDLEIQAAEEQLKKLKVKKAKQLAQKKIKCASCTTATKIADIDLFSVYEWHESYNSYEDSGYDFKEYRYICQHCDAINHMSSELQWQIPYEARRTFNIEREFMNINRDLFKSITRYDIPRHVNYYGSTSEAPPKRKSVRNYHMDDLKLYSQKVQDDYNFQIESKKRGKW